MSARDKDDDEPTRPDPPLPGAPTAPLDIAGDAEPAIPEAETARLGGKKPAEPRTARAHEVDPDGLWNIYEAALRAWGKMTVLGAPRDAEHAVVTGCGSLREYLESLATPKTEQEARRVALQAMQLKAALDAYEVWAVGRRQELGLDRAREDA